MSLTTGEIIDGKYRIVRLIGEGGMGAVYEGDNLRIHRRVAIKVLHANVAGNANAVQRFEREAQAAGRIGSEHIVEVLDLGNMPNGDRYMVMEFLDGQSLSGRIQQRGRLSAAELYPIARDILEGLTAAHGAGIIHRDLKPDNVFLLHSRAGRVDFVKLLDFGISKFSTLSGESGFSMTRTGAVMGTPYYMSPEQAKGSKSMDQRADLYAVGVILYEALTGQVPFNADTFNELLFKIVLEQPAPVEQLVPDVDLAFAAIVAKGMAREPAHRYQTAREFQQALDQWATTGAGPAAIAALQAAAPRAAMPSAAGLPAHQAIGSGTPGVWSSSGSYSEGATPPPQKRSKTAIVLGAAALGAIILGGGGLAAFELTRPHAPAAAANSAVPAPSSQLAADAEKAELAAKQAEEAAQLAREQAERSKTTPQPKPAAAADAGAPPGASAKPPKRKRVWHPVVRRRTPTPTQKAPEVGGRIFRNNL